MPGLGAGLKTLADEKGLLLVDKNTPRLPPVSQELTDVAHLARCLAEVEGTCMLITHPGFNVKDMRAFVHPGLNRGNVARQRDTDRRVPTDHKTLEFCKYEEIELLTFEAYAHL